MREEDNEYFVWKLFVEVVRGHFLLEAGYIEADGGNELDGVHFWGQAHVRVGVIF